MFSVFITNFVTGVRWSELQGTKQITKHKQIFKRFSKSINVMTMGLDLDSDLWLDFDSFSFFHSQNTAPKSIPQRLRRQGGTLVSPHGHIVQRM